MTREKCTLDSFSSWGQYASADVYLVHKILFHNTISEVLCLVLLFFSTDYRNLRLKMAGTAKTVCFPFSREDGLLIRFYSVSMLYILRAMNVYVNEDLLKDLLSIYTVKDLSEFS